MAEHGADNEPIEEAPAMAASAAPVADAAALALSLTRRRGGKTDARLDDFLDKQTRMLELQMEHLHEQRGLQVEHLKQQEKHLRLRYFGDRLRIGLQILGILGGLAIAAFLSAMAWNAHEDHGVSIEAFSVPPDLAQRGLTGQVVASQILDRLATLQAATVTARPASTYANDWGGDIKVEIPETGVSIGELNRYLRQWLGGETRISGELVRTPAGLAVTARADASPGRRFQGAEADIDKLVDQAAEAVYADTQPYRYAVYLASIGHKEQALAAFARLATSGRPVERAWAYTGWASLLWKDYKFRQAAAVARKALAIDPHLQSAEVFLTSSVYQLGRLEEAVEGSRRIVASLKGPSFNPSGAQDRVWDLVTAEGELAELRADYPTAVRLLTREQLAMEGFAYDIRQDAGLALIASHDVTAGARLMVGLIPVPDDRIALEDWKSVTASLDALLRAPNSAPISAPRFIAMTATVYAHAGRLAEARALLSDTAMDCAWCLMARGLLAAQQRDWAAVDRWYGEAARQTPSVPLAYTDWGKALLEKGDLDGAIDKLSRAHRITPAFADPLELWGEALMRKGDLAGAIAKFQAADKSAPRWGRNHMMWGEALMLSGRYAEARRQYEIASGLDLSKPDRAALNVLLARTAKGPLHG